MKHHLLFTAAASLILFSGAYIVDVTALRTLGESIMGVGIAFGLMSNLALQMRGM